MRAFARDQGVTPSIVVTRLQHRGWLQSQELYGLENQMEWAPPGTYADY